MSFALDPKKLVLAYRWSLPRVRVPEGHHLYDPPL